MRHGTVEQATSRFLRRVNEIKTTQHQMYQGTASDNSLAIPAVQKMQDHTTDAEHKPGLQVR